MNKKRLAKIAEWLEAGAPHTMVKVGGGEVPVNFSMKRGIGLGGCGTTCCIAGAAVQFFDKWQFKHFLAEILDEEDEYANLIGREASWPAVAMQAEYLLGLTDEQADELFTPGANEVLADYDDAEWAARTIRHLIETGEVDWEATK